MLSQNSQNIDEQLNDVNIKHHGSKDIIINTQLVGVLSADQLCIVNQVNTEKKSSTIGDDDLKNSVLPEHAEDGSSDETNAHHE